MSGEMVKSQKELEMLDTVIRLQNLHFTLADIALESQQEQPSKSFDMLHKDFVTDASALVRFIVTDPLLLRIIKKELVYRITQGSLTNARGHP